MRKLLTVIICSLLWACNSTPIEQAVDIRDNIGVYPFSLKHQVREAIREGNKPAPALIMLHGLHSNENDLMPLARAIDKRICVISVQAPLSDEPNEYKWFNIRFEGHKILCDDLQAERSRTILVQFIDEVVEAYNLDERNIILMGFSQGGMIAYQFAISTPHLVKGTAILNSYILESNKLKIGDVQDLRKSKLFISHGADDQVIPYHRAVESMQFLDNLGVPYEFKLYPIGHKINEQNLIDVVNWLEDILF